MRTSKQKSSRTKSASSSKMTSRLPVTSAASVSQDQNQNHVRTRSQLALPEFDIEYDRSPLKNAREALRRAKARYGKPSSGVNEGRVNGGVDVTVGVDAKMKEVMARAKSGSSSNPFRRSATEKEAKESEEMGTNGTRLKPAEAGVGAEEGSTTTPRPPSNPFDFSAEVSDESPRYPKRGRSASFDEGVVSQSTGSFGKVDDGNTPSVRPTAPAHSNLLEISSEDNASRFSTTTTSSSDSTPTISGESNPKRVKLGSQKTLGAFFARPSSQSKDKPAKPSQPGVSPTLMIVREATSGTSHLEESSSTPQNGKLSAGNEAILYPKTPTIKELRAIPSLDLRTMTPSPRKRALQIGLGTPGPKSTAKARAVTAGAAFTRSRSEAVEDDLGSCDETGKGKRATSEPRDEVAASEQRSVKTPPRTPTVPQHTLPLLGAERESRTMDVDVDQSAMNNTEAISTGEDTPRSIIRSTSGSSAVDSSASTTVELVEEPDIPDLHLTGDTPRLEARTPLHKILPSRPVPSRHPPSTNGHLSRVFGTSPLTPLSALGPSSGDSDDYKEEERHVQEESKRAADLEAAKLAMQAEGEPEPDFSEEQPQQSPGPLFSAGPSKPVPISPTVTRKASTKSKQKGKALSSASRIATGAAGIKKRKSLLPTASATPRMRLTRASVLRQKAIQSQIRTPKDKGRRSSILPSKNVTTKPSKDESETKDKGVTKEVSGQQGNGGPGERKKTEPEPRRAPRKTFVLTVPSSLSPRKAGSASSSANSSGILKSTPLQSSPSKLSSFSLYPPSLNDTAATEQAQRALDKLSSALDKLAMPPPTKPNITISRHGAELKRPASEQPERIRPATSLGFTREMSVPATGTGSKENGQPRSASRAGSVEPARRFLPPPPPAFGSSLAKEKGKVKASASASRTAPVAFGANASNIAGGSQIRPPSSFRFGLGAGGVFGRPIPRIRASKKTTLETVQGSPVKGGGEMQGPKEDEDEIMPPDSVGGPGDSGAEADASASSSNANADTSISSMESGDNPTDSDATVSANGKELKRISRLNASRRASMAFSTLAQSLGVATSPDAFSPQIFNLGGGNMEERTPTESTTANRKGPGSATSSTASSRPVRAAAPRSFGFGAPALSRMQSETAFSNNGRASSLTPSLPSESDGEGPGRGTTKKSGGAMGRTKMPGSLDVLDQCTIFVDVRTEEGEDAGALFVDMLRGLGAKVLTRVGQTCTHIVYKNGLSSTVTRYRLLDEPRPKVVGIGWVVECAEKRARVDESRFQVDLENANIAGTLKRRRSFLPKQIISTQPPGPMDAFLNGSTSGSDTATATNPAPRACADSDVTSEDGDTSQERVLSGSSLSSNIHPLERARRRSIMIPR